jgi:hypothetical protein
VTATTAPRRVAPRLAPAATPLVNPAPATTPAPPVTAPAPAPATVAAPAPTTVPETATTATSPDLQLASGTRAPEDLPSGPTLIPTLALVALGGLLFAAGYWCYVTVLGRR